jgi:rubrerythrin
MHPNLPGRRPASEEAPPFRVPPSLAGPKKVFLSCHYCGYSPSIVPPEGACPKCGGHSWERYAISTRLLPAQAV